MRTIVVDGDYEIVPYQIKGWGKTLKRYKVRYRGFVVREWLSLRQARRIIKEHAQRNSQKGDG